MHLWRRWLDTPACRHHSWFLPTCHKGTESTTTALSCSNFANEPSCPTDRCTWTQDPSSGHNVCIELITSVADNVISTLQPVDLASLNTTRVIRRGDGPQAPHPLGHTLSDAVAWLDRGGRYRRQAVSGRTPVNIDVSFDGSVSSSRQAIFLNAAVSETP